MKENEENFSYKKVLGAKKLIECGFYFDEEIVDHINEKIAFFETERSDDLRKELFQLSPPEFEDYVAEHFNRMGYDVQPTGPTSFRDGGIDLVVIDNRRKVGSILVAVQIKHHRKNHKTGRKTVDRLLAWKGSHFRIGVLVTNTTFTKDVFWIASQPNNRPFIRLRDFNDLSRWSNHDYISKENWREIPDKINLAPGVTVKIPEPSS